MVSWLGLTDELVYEGGRFHPAFDRGLAQPLGCTRWEGEANGYRQLRDDWVGGEFLHGLLGKLLDELVDTFVSEVYDPTWDEPNRTVLVRAPSQAPCGFASYQIVREEVENTWHVWLTQSGLPQTQLVHAMWQRAMKSHAYAHPTARSLV